MKVLAIIVNYRTAPLAVEAIEALLPELAALDDSRAIVVDNASGDGSVEALQAAVAARGWGDRVTVLASPNNGGFGAGVNIGLRHGLAMGAGPDYFYLLNPDAAPRAGAISPLVDFLDGDPGAGIAGSSLYAPDGEPHASAFRFPTIMSELDHGLRLGLVTRLLSRWVVPMAASEETARVDWVAGASMMIRRSVLENVGFFDEGFFLYFEETDFCLRAHRRGWSIWRVGGSAVWHVGGAATGMEHRTDKRAPARQRRRLPRYWFESRRRYFEKNHGALYRMAADAGFALGYAAWRVRRRIQRKPDNDPPRLLWDFLRCSLSRAAGGGT